ncbi:hypothetical protein COHAPHLL_00383 [Vibrio phage V09]|uniref:Uncharacterized protein n=1 Tax=Vibrio phage V09 TaxID=2724327 RepID=A0A6H0X9W1_9CAUD|nr:hypothetical protein COHAPHLL_00383 [Vibrio phage V09]
MDIGTLTALCERAALLSVHLPVEKRDRCLSMIDVLLANSHWPDLKIGGWLEHIITVCIENGITTIDAEREFSRPIKHAYYRSIGLEPPVTIDLSRSP